MQVRKARHSENPVNFDSHCIYNYMKPKLSFKERDEKYK